MTINTTWARTTLVASLLVACGVAASRAPLGGNYSAPESAPSHDRRASAEPPASAPPPAREPDAAVVSAMPAASAGAALADVDAGEVPKTTVADTLHFEPFHVGSRIDGELTVGAAAQLQGGPPGMATGGKFSVAGRLRAEIRVLKVSPQSLDEIELTLTVLAMQSEFGGQQSQSQQEPPETFDITLSTPPSIRPRSGSKVVPLGRVKIALVVVPLAEFYGRWARSPTLELKPGWSRELPLPFAGTLFPPTRDESMRTGPLRARFNARTGSADTVPFELTLPLRYKNDLGAVDVELSGSAHLNAKSGRPTAFDLNGPMNASGGPRGSQLNVVGTAKLGGTFNYP